MHDSIRFATMPSSCLDKADSEMMGSIWCWAYHESAWRWFDTQVLLRMALNKNPSSAFPQATRSCGASCRLGGRLSCAPHSPDPNQLGREALCNGFVRLRLQACDECTRRCAFQIEARCTPLRETPVVDETSGFACVLPVLGVGLPDTRRDINRANGGYRGALEANC